jgi:hypothetical protein
VIDSIGGIRIVVSPLVPPPGWRRKERADAIERENLATLCAGGSLGELESPRSWWTGLVLINPPPNGLFRLRRGEQYFIAHPDVQRELERRRLREMAPFMHMQTA